MGEEGGSTGISSHWVGASDIKLHKAKWVQHSCSYYCLFPCSLLTVQSESFILNFMQIIFTQKVQPVLFWWDNHPLMTVPKLHHLLGDLKVVFSNLDSPLGSFNECWSREHFKVFVFLMLQLWLNIDHLHKWDTCSVGSCTGVDYCLHRGLNIVWLTHGKTQEGLWFDPEESVCIEENCFADAVGGSLVDELLNLTVRWEF